MRGKRATKLCFLAGLVTAAAIFVVASLLHCLPGLAAGALLSSILVFFSMMMVGSASELEKRRSKYSGRLPNTSYLRKFRPGYAAAFALALGLGLVPTGIFFDTRFLYMTLALVVSAKILHAVHRTVTPRE